MSFGCFWGEHVELNENVSLVSSGDTVCVRDWLNITGKPSLPARERKENEQVNTYIKWDGSGDSLFHYHKTKLKKYAKK